MTAILPLLIKIGPWLLGALGIAFGWVRHKQAQTATAQADAKVSDAQKQVAQAQTSEAQANEDAQKAGSDAAAARTQIDNDTAAESPKEVRDELQNWTRGS